MRVHSWQDGATISICLITLNNNVKARRGIVCPAGRCARSRIEKRRRKKTTREEERSNAGEVTIRNGGSEEEWCVQNHWFLKGGIPPQSRTRR